MFLWTFWCILLPLKTNISWLKLKAKFEATFFEQQKSRFLQKLRNFYRKITKPLTFFHFSRILEIGLISRARNEWPISRDFSISRISRSNPSLDASVNSSCFVVTQITKSDKTVGVLFNEVNHNLWSWISLRLKPDRIRN